MRTLLPSLFLSVTLLFGCSEQSLTEVDSSGNVPIGINASESIDYSAASKKSDLVEICHVPDGNAANHQTLFVSTSGAAGHLKHGDVVGSCDVSTNNSAPVISNLYPGGAFVSFTSSTTLVLSATVTDLDAGAVLTVQACFGVSGYTSTTCVDMNQSGSTWSFSYDWGNYSAGYDHYWQVVASDGLSPDVISPVVSFHVEE